MNKIDQLNDDKISNKEDLAKYMDALMLTDSEFAKAIENFVKESSEFVGAAIEDQVALGIIKPKQKFNPGW